MKKLLTVLIAAALALTAYPVFASIQGSPHDCSGPTYSYGLCEACHVPHAASGSKRLWTKLPVSFSSSVLGFSNWSTPKQIGVGLCGTCHLSAGPLAGITNKAGLGAHDMHPATGGGAYADTSHNNKMAVLGGSLETPAQNGAISGKPYTALNATMECTSCHNPHQDGTVAGTNTVGTGIRPFLRSTNTTETISDFCGECHATREDSGTATLTANDNTNDGSTVGTGITDPGGLVSNWNHNHPVNIAYGNNNASEWGYYQALAAGATPLTTALPHGINNNALLGWSLGGKFLDNNGAPITSAGSLGVAGETAAPGTDPSHFIGCQTCHAVHNPGTDPTAMNGGTAQGTWLLAVGNTGAPGAGKGDGHADLCETCHGQTTAGVTRVGGNPGGGDHPIDVVLDAATIATFVTAWSGPNRNFDSSSLRKTVDRSAETWPRGTTNIIICTSCHSAHRAGARLRRQNGDGTLWCKSCHPSVAPLGHHSNKYNASFSTLDCTGCHTTALVGASGLAHNGFSFYNVAGDNTGNQAQDGTNETLAPNTVLGGTNVGCSGCHYGNGNVINPPGALNGMAPINRLGTAQGGSTFPGMAQSHYVGAFATNDLSPNLGINVKTGFWNNNAMVPDHLGHRRDYSKYGNLLPGDATYTDGSFNFTVNPVSDTTVVWVGCESCHSVLGNIGRASTGPILASMSSGWANNLLLQDYRDDSYSAGWNTSAGGPGLTQANAMTVGSEFCVGCHNQGNAHSQAANTGGGPGGAVPAVVIISDGKGGSMTLADPNDIAPPSMHPMTGWSITKAEDAGRAANVAGATNALMTTDTSDPATYGTYANAATRPPTGGGSTDTGTGAVSYPGTNEMDCDSCHRPHNASPTSYSDSAHIATHKHTTGQNIPTILEFADTANDNGTFCMKCHNY